MRRVSWCDEGERYVENGAEHHAEKKKNVRTYRASRPTIGVRLGGGCGGGCGSCATQHVGEGVAKL